jgi:para-aminobenzoate synthetase
VRTLLIDNYDSYTYNLYQLISVTYGVEPVVIHNDDPAWLDLSLSDFDAIVISPGPGRPDVDRDVGWCRDALLSSGLPVLGVCLGHQLIAAVSGAVVAPAPRPRHGHLTTVRHTGTDLFAGLPQEFTAVRYHSLAVPEPLPPSLEPLAWAEDGVLMGLRHRDRPWWGVQFHPESVCSEQGAAILANFRGLVLGSSLVAEEGCPSQLHTVRRLPSSATRVKVRTIDEEADTGDAFGALFGGEPYAVWLDSAALRPGLSRFSYLGAPLGPLGEVLTYDVGQPVFETLEQRLHERAVEAPAGLPFDFAGGYVGYFGYELKADCGGRRRHEADTPDAVWVFVDRLVVVDHEERTTYLVAVGDGGERWLDEAAAALTPASPITKAEPATAPADIERWLDRDRARYLADIADCQRQLRAGESYEICLTNTLRMPAGPDPLAGYHELRRHNPAPYGAFLRLGDVTVLSSSPERFLRVTADGRAESRPIKGTAPRYADPIMDGLAAHELAADPKTRAENMMIVDLVRNDLGQVCEVGSVAVDTLMGVESYATVHQLVSTVSGRLRPDVSAVAAARACFPGGSMTGAPKVRTMEIIDRLETGARGIYSGALGYFSVTGAADLSIVIRTAVWRDGVVTVGAGGAIVLASDPNDEYEEMLLKFGAVLGAIGPDRVGAPSIGWNA